MFQDDIVVLVVVKEAEGQETTWHAAGPRHAVRELHFVNNGLYSGVVGWLLALAEWKRTDARAVVGVVAFGRDNPLRPADRLEVDVELAPVAVGWRCPISSGVVCGDAASGTTPRFFSHWVVLFVPCDTVVVEQDQNRSVRAEP